MKKPFRYKISLWEGKGACFRVCPHRISCSLTTRGYLDLSLASVKPKHLLEVEFRLVCS